MTTDAQVSWTLSGFGDEIDPDPRVQIAVLKALGAQHIEVRSAWGVNVVDLSDEQLAELASLLKDAGLGVSAVASPIGKVDISLDPELEVRRLQRIIRVAHALETEHPHLLVLPRRRRSGGEHPRRRDDRCACSPTRRRRSASRSCTRTRRTSTATPRARSTWSRPSLAGRCAWPGTARTSCRSASPTRTTTATRSCGRTSTTCR
jgi:hypothetical protein